MRLTALLHHLDQHGGRLIRAGHFHALWQNPATGKMQAVPQQPELSNRLAVKICGALSLPSPK